MSVLIVCNDLSYFLRHRASVADALEAAGTKATVIAGGAIPGYEHNHAWALRVTTIERFRLSVFDDLKLFWRTLKLIRNQKPEAVFLITLKPMVFSGLASLLAQTLTGHPKRLVVAIPGLGRLMEPRKREGLGRRLAKGVVNFVIRRLSSKPNTHFLFENDHDRNEWITNRLISEPYSEVIAGAGVNNADYYPAAERRSGPIRILIATRLLKAKGLDVFIEIAKRMADNPNVEFHVAGIDDPVDPDRFDPAILEREASIKFHGEITEIPELLRSMDIVCLPTRYGEGVPRILIEAAATGLPAIASDMPGCRRIIEDGVTGFIVPARPRGKAAKEVYAAISSYLADPGLLDRHGKAALAKYRGGGFEEDAVVTRIVQLLNGETAPVSSTPQTTEIPD